MPSIDFEAIEEDSSISDRLKNRISQNTKEIKVAAYTIGSAAKNNFRNNTSKKLLKGQITKYSDASYYANTERNIKMLSDAKKIKKCEKEIDILNELIKHVKQELVTAPKDISTGRKFASDAVAAATGGIAGDSIDYNKDKWNQILDGLEANKKRFEKLKREIPKVKKENTNLLDW